MFLCGSYLLYIGVLARGLHEAVPAMNKDTDSLVSGSSGTRTETRSAATGSQSTDKTELPATAKRRVGSVGSFESAGSVHSDAESDSAWLAVDSLEDHRQLLIDIAAAIPGAGASVAATGRVVPSLTWLVPLIMDSFNGKSAGLKGSTLLSGAISGDLTQQLDAPITALVDRLEAGVSVSDKDIDKICMAVGQAGAAAAGIDTDAITLDKSTGRAHMTRLAHHGAILRSALEALPQADQKPGARSIDLLSPVAVADLLLSYAQTTRI